MTAYLLYLQINETEFMYFIIAPSSTFSLVNLRNRTGEERRRQTLCDKRDNNFVWNNFSPNFTFLYTDLFVKDQKVIALSRLSHTNV